jgi:Family of unknown function (DUF6130)
MTMRIKTLAAVAAGAVLATNAFAQSTKEVRGASPYVAIENEPPPKLVVDPTPLAAGLAHDIVWIQYRVENVHIVPVFGAGALNVSHGSGICTYTSTTCLGVGWKRVTTIQSAWQVCRQVSTRYLSSWSTLNTTFSLGARSAGRR